MRKDLFFFAAGVVLTALGIKYSNAATLWDAVLLLGIAVMVFSIVDFILRELSATARPKMALIGMVASAAAFIGCLWWYASSRPHEPEGGTTVQTAETPPIAPPKQNTQFAPLNGDAWIATREPPGVRVVSATIDKKRKLSKVKIVGSIRLTGPVGFIILRDGNIVEQFSESSIRDFNTRTFNLFDNVPITGELTYSIHLYSDDRPTGVSHVKGGETWMELTEVEPDS